jgi:hypothetical protein
MNNISIFMLGAVNAYHVLSKKTHIQTNSNPIQESSDKRLESNKQVIRNHTVSWLTSQTNQVTYS